MLYVRLNNLSKTKTNAQDRQIIVAAAGLVKGSLHLMIRAKIFDTQF